MVKSYLKFFLLFVGIVVLIMIGSALLRLISTPINAGVGVIEKTVNADSIIDNYQWYYSMYGEIKATELKYKVAKESGLPEASGIKMVLASMVEEYNARSRMINRNLWKAKDLPHTITIE